MSQGCQLPRQAGRDPGGLLTLYAATLFLSAWLLFTVQPMAAKMLLPLLGGSPSVWNTCLVFFQAVLLLGYGYAHLLSTRLAPRSQVLAHAAVLALPLLALPIHRPEAAIPPAHANPTAWLLALLAAVVGLPFFVVSTSAPLLQRWFSRSGHRDAADPYFLYAASNAGSLLGLLAYPTLIEPTLTLTAQTRVWGLAYAGFAVLGVCCALTLWRNAGPAPQPAAWPGPIQPAGSSPRALWRERAHWLALSAVPSSLLLGVTTYLSTDLAAVPLLWVVPLSLYLLTFILVFARRPPVSPAVMHRLLPLTVLPLAILMAASARKPLGLLIALHLVVFFVAAMVCHGALARRRPPAHRLTEFYVCLSVGGVLGGLFNALAAPLLFKTVVEYPLAIVLACLLRPARLGGPRTASFGTPVGDPAWRRGARLGRTPETRRDQVFDYLIPVGVGVFTASLALLTEDWPPAGRTAALAGLPALLCGLWTSRPLRFGLAVGAFLAVSATARMEWNRVLHVERSFFGVHRVVRLEPHHLLMHGTTIHGAQHLEPARRCDPLAYFSTGSPIGQVFASQAPRLRRVGVVGLGAGTLASYSAPEQDWTFYEIDPAVLRIAADPRWFTYLGRCLTRGRVVLGDARLTLAGAPDRWYDLLVLDAFSSDSIPMHLLTREAMQLYLRKLGDGGLLALHLTNRFLDLERPIGDLAASMGLVCLAQHHRLPRSGPEGASSRWLLIARRGDELEPWIHDPRWRLLEGRPGVRVWTDDFTNLLQALPRHDAGR
ncbi:MAG: fused MFS/spermidine synthase [Candidatus Omnitrophica bacterium]|nr:fused MFS/spermidine synthase [Candidatus Omnitrophota bacterium]